MQLPFVPAIDKSGGKYLLCGKWRHSVKCWQENRERVVPCWWPLRKAQHTKTDSYSSYLVLHFVWTIALLFLNEKANQACITTELCVQSEASHSFLVSSTQSSLALRQLFRPWSIGRCSSLLLNPEKKFPSFFVKKGLTECRNTSASIY